MVVPLGLEPRLGTNLVLLVYKTSDATLHHGTISKFGAPCRDRTDISCLEGKGITTMLMVRIIRLTFNHFIQLEYVVSLKIPLLFFKSLIKSGAGGGNRTLTRTLATFWATTTPHPLICSLSHGHTTQHESHGVGVSYFSTRAGLELRFLVTQLR